MDVLRHQLNVVKGATTSPLAVAKKRIHFLALGLCISTHKHFPHSWNILGKRKNKSECRYCQLLDCSNDIMSVLMHIFILLATEREKNDYYTDNYYNVIQGGNQIYL